MGKYQFKTRQKHYIWECYLDVLMIDIEQVFRGVIRTLSNIYDGAFDRKHPLKTVNYFQKKRSIIDV